jgi:hypothetical protein
MVQEKEMTSHFPTVRKAMPAVSFQFSASLPEGVADLGSPCA